MLSSPIGDCRPKFGVVPHFGEKEYVMRQIIKPLLVSSACTLALGLAAITLSEIAMAQVSVSITLAPPALPVYEQPMLVEEGGIWAPGHWSYNQDGYFWVPGTWVQPPEVGLLWTPGYWGWGNGGYAWNAGYWGPTVGFYGGITAQPSAADQAAARGNTVALERQHQTQAMAERHTMEQKTLQETQEAKPAAKHEARHS